MAARLTAIAKFGGLVALLCAAANGVADPVKLVSAHERRSSAVAPNTTQVIQCGAFKSRASADKRLKQLRAIRSLELDVIREGSLFLVIGRAPKTQLKATLQRVKIKVPDAFIRNGFGVNTKRLTQLVGH